MKIAIAGYGIEGKVSYEYFQSQGNEVTILDERNKVADLPSDAKVILGGDAFSRLEQFDMVVRTPSLAPSKLKGAKKIWSATNEFFAQCPVPIIGVTGTKGKGTTASLIASILKQSGRTVHLLGNIGTPALEVLKKIQPGDSVVYELSSFQLWDIEKSPHIAVVLMIEPDHLDVHASFDEYVQAKQNIVRFQGDDDRAIFTADNKYAAAIGVSSRASHIPIPTDETAHVQDGHFWYGSYKVCPVSSLTIPGEFNQVNACAAIAAVWPFVQDGDSISKGLSEFTGLPHRLKFVREVNGVRYYDDSIATTVGSAVAAIKAFNQPKIIILGGSSKGITNFDAVAITAASSGVKKVFLIGEQAPNIQHALEMYDVDYENLGNQITMEHIVQRAHQLAEAGEVVILSPACASYDMFKGYADRGDQFIRAVESL